MFDPTTPKGFYFNRGVFRFGRMVESDMAAAEAQARKNRKGGAADRLANAARLGQLEKHLGVTIKRHKDPGGAVSNNPFKQEELPDKEETIVLRRGF